jgi:hypothetical protein
MIEGHLLIDNVFVCLSDVGCSGRYGEKSGRRSNSILGDAAAHANQ